MILQLTPNTHPILHERVKKCRISDLPSFLQCAIFDELRAAMSRGKFLNSILTKPLSIKSFFKSG